MSLSIQQIVTLIIIIVAIIISLKNVSENKELNEVIDSIISGCSTILTFICMIFFYEKIDEIIVELLSKILVQKFKYNGFAHIFALVIAFCLIKLVIDIILKILNKLSFNSFLKKITSKKYIRTILAIVFGVIRGCVAIIVICIPFVLYNNISDKKIGEDFLKDYKPYVKVEDLLDNSKLRFITDGLAEEVSIDSVTYYNGITIESGVKSNDQIDSFARELVKDEMDTRSKAHKIYQWVGENISYDDAKVSQIMDENKKVESGAIPTFRSREGICLDYACLMTAMLRANEIKSRIIIGEAYNGNEFVSHAWNEVYIPEEDKWINADATFYSAGNYFDNENFNIEHKKTSTAGEF